MQGNDSRPSYFFKLRNLWDEFASIVPQSCDCSRSREFNDYVERQKLMQFLMGLNEMYDQSKSQILMIEPTSNLNKAYDMLVERESQRSIGNSNMQSEYANFTTLLAAKGINSQLTIGEGITLRSLTREISGVSAHMAGKGMYYQHNKGASYQHFQKVKRNWNKKCDYCKMQGHVMDECFKLHGYPPDWKFKKKGTGSTAYNVQVGFSTPTPQCRIE